MLKLIWNECRPGEEWQAGGLNRLFSIIKNDAGTFSIRQWVGDGPSRAVPGTSPTLAKAQQRCEDIVNNCC